MCDSRQPLDGAGSEDQPAERAAIEAVDDPRDAWAVNPSRIEQSARCPRRASGQHHWQAGPVTALTYEVGDYGETYRTATELVLFCECGELSRRSL